MFVSSKKDFNFKTEFNYSVFRRYRSKTIIFQIKIVLEKIDNISKPIAFLFFEKSTTTNVFVSSKKTSSISKLISTKVFSEHIEPNQAVSRTKFFWKNLTNFLSL